MGYFQLYTLSCRANSSKYLIFFSDCAFQKKKIAQLINTSLAFGKICKSQMYVVETLGKPL